MRHKLALSQFLTDRGQSAQEIKSVLQYGRYAENLLRKEFDQIVISDENTSKALASLQRDDPEEGRKMQYALVTYYHYCNGHPFSSNSRKTLKNSYEEEVL